VWGISHITLTLASQLTKNKKHKEETKMKLTKEQFNKIVEALAKEEYTEKQMLWIYDNLDEKTIDEIFEAVAYKQYFAK
jgi:hypothetical protein